MRGLIRGTFLLLLLLQVAAFFQARHLLLWKVALGVREFGHWAAALLLALALLALLSKATRLWALPLLALAGVYAAPAAWAAWRGAAVQRQAALALGLPPEAAGFSWRRAFALRPGPGAEMQTLTFARPGGLPLDLDLFPGQRQGPRPFVVVVHSGGWDGGTRTEFQALNARLAASGIAVASLDYRLAPGATWPAPKEDVLSAIRFLQAHAKGLHLDPARFALLGRSAGGQIAERVAYGEALPGLKALVAFYAPADLDFAYAYSKPDDLLHSRQLEEAYLGGDPRTRAAAYHDASAPRFVTGDAPPTLLFHGPGDPLVWFKQSERLKAKLDAEKVPNALLSLPFATHGFDWTPSGPDGQLADGLVAAFLEARLKP